MVTTTSILKQNYKEYANPLDKIKRDVDKGILIRINRGLYEDNKSVNPCFLAAALLSPSYLSFDWSLSYYGLIPEKVFAITSASLGLRKNKTYENFFGRYEFSDISPNVFSEGLTYLNEGEYFAKIATREKTICDSLCKWRVVNSIKQLKELLFEDKRIDINEFEKCNFIELIRLASLYKKTNLNILISFVRKEYLHE